MFRKRARGCSSRGRRRRATFSMKECGSTAGPASTQKLLTALIIAEHGFLDQRVVVAPVDTYASRKAIQGGRRV